MIAGLLVCWIIPSLVGGAATAPPRERCGITEPFPYLTEQNPDIIRKRFGCYQQLGVDIIRIHVFADSVDPMAVYVRVLKDFDFRLKVILLNLPGETAFQLTDEHGALSKQAVDYWNPDARRVVEERTAFLIDRLKTQGLMERTDYLIPFLGPAGEAIYPHPWTTGLPEPTFWCYGRYAQQAFRDSMRAKYPDVAAANAIWGTGFDSWAAVKVLPPGANPGPYWEDVLTWYRDSKRDFVRWSIDMLRRHTEKRLLLYIPGTHVSDADWREAVRTANGNVLVKIMTDTDFLVDLAAEKGCWLQYTGVDNRPEAHYVAERIRVKGYYDLRMWGENAGDIGCANDPAALADTVIGDALFGLDYTHAHFVFEPDGVTPNALFPKLREAYARIKRELANEVHAPRQ